MIIDESITTFSIRDRLSRALRSNSRSTAAGIVIWVEGKKYSLDAPLNRGAELVSMR